MAIHDGLNQRSRSGGLPAARLAAGRSGGRDGPADTVAAATSSSTTYGERVTGSAGDVSCPCKPLIPAETPRENGHHGPDRIDILPKVAAHLLPAAASWNGSGLVGRFR